MERYELKEFDRAAEESFWARETQHTVGTEELDALESDMRLWVPGFPKLFEGRNILDIGAGRAPLGILVAQRFKPKWIVSADLGRERLFSALPWKTKLKNLDLVSADVYHLPFDDNSFDYILANSFLHHLPRLNEAVTELVRVLRPGGQYIGREPNFNNPLVRTAVFTFDGTWIRRGARITPNEYPLRAQQITDAFSIAGCDCQLHYFWRRLRILRHRKLSFAISVRARRLPSAAMRVQFT